MHVTVNAAAQPLGLDPQEQRLLWLLCVPASGEAYLFSDVQIQDVKKLFSLPPPGIPPQNAPQLPPVTRPE